MIGATGTIGRATVRALLRHGHEVVCFVRPKAAKDPAMKDPAAKDRAADDSTRRFLGATVRTGEVTDPTSLARDGLRGEHFDALVSCLASRTGTPKDAWAIDHQAQRHALNAVKAAGATHAVLLSAICVQKPLLAFQHAKLAFEKELMASGLTWSIVRATAFFKSLSGQIDRVKKGKPFLVFGDGTLTACKPISDDDLGDFIAGCLNEPMRHHRILPIGGPGEAITPQQQGEALFQMLGQPPRFKRVPVALLDVIVAVLSTFGRVEPKLAEKAELARIGRYYATESMLVWDAAAGRYDAAATPSHGTQTLLDHYRGLLSGAVKNERGEHAVF